MQTRHHVVAWVDADHLKDAVAAQDHALEGISTHRFPIFRVLSIDCCFGRDRSFDIHRSFEKHCRRVSYRFAARVCLGTDFDLDCSFSDRWLHEEALFGVVVLRLCEDFDFENSLEKVCELVDADFGSELMSDCASVHLYGDDYLDSYPSDQNLDRGLSSRRALA